MFKPIKYRSHNGYDTAEASDAAVVRMSGETLTIASQAEDTDINVIVRRMTANGIMPRMSARVPEYGDYSNATDYRSALHVIMEAEESFQALDPKVRSRFQNDPQLFLDFCNDPANIGELAKMGLARDGYKPKETGNAGVNTDARAASGASGSSVGGNAEGVGAGKGGAAAG